VGIPQMKIKKKQKVAVTVKLVVVVVVEGNRVKEVATRNANDS
jgi:hypothetical protein